MTIARALLEEARATKHVVLYHRKAHTGNPWNEFADVAAKFHANSDQEGWRLQDYCDELKETTELKWQWLQHAPSKDRRAYPYNDKTKFLFQKNPHYIQTDNLPEVQPEKFTKAAHKFRVMTYNALSLNDKQGVLPRASKGTKVGKMKLLCMQLTTDQILLAGIQESRKPRGERQLHGYLAIHSGSDNGKYGCTLLISQHTPYAPVGSKKIYLNN